MNETLKNTNLVRDKLAKIQTDLQDFKAKADQTTAQTQAIQETGVLYLFIPYTL